MNTANCTPIIPGYQINSQLYAGSRTRVYRAIREQDQLVVIIKLLASEYPSFNELLQFCNQYTISKHLDISGIIHPLSLELYGKSYILVMEDAGLICLREYIKSTTLPLVEFLDIAIQLTNILHDLHQNRVIHKDIKPANILIHPETKQVQLIDFSIASLLPKETQEITNPNVLEGTLAYISPEQTGRMNRGIDYRSDYYSLGVTFYEILTGKLPFISDDPMELVHSHIAQQAGCVSDIKLEIPKVINEIINKLMAKNAEDRYQSALGLKSDLEKCFDQLKDTGEIRYFEIGKRDVCDRFLIPEKLYGRETEVQTLLEAFDRVSNGKTEMMLVAGFSGIGKTAVINQVYKPITRKHGYFIKGKFDQFNRNIPLAAFVQALRDLMGQLFSESDAQLERWKTKILEAVGENGQVLIEVIPELEKIIGKELAAPELSATSAQNRFNLLFQKFIKVFSTKEHPLVIFLDDLQWTDSASLHLIKLLMGENGYLFVLGAYRDNEVDVTHPFMLTVEELLKRGNTVNIITLAPLTLSDTNQLVGDTLNCPTERSHPLTELVDRKTQGNSFFITQFLKALHEDGQITFNRHQGYWECDIAQIQTLSLTSDVVEFMATQLQKLPSETQRILQLAACIGNEFDLATLAIVSEQSEADAASALWKALQSGLILPQNQVYKFYLSHDQGDANTGDSENVGYRFLHDRIQQAAYCLIPDRQRQATHLKIGQLLLRNSTNNNLLHPIFQQAAQILNPLQTLANTADPDISIQASTKASGSSNSSINIALDFAVILKACQNLSSTIQLDELLHQLTQIILQNSGGDRCALILPNRDGNWYLKAITTSDTKLFSEPLEDNPNIPVKLIQYVKNTQEVVTLHNLKTDLPVIDKYLIQRQPKSLLCLPILNQGHLIGILYLENQSTSGVFTSDRILILNFLCIQAAISLENARLYQQAQTYAQQVEQSQLQIVQNEKMASLGNLVTGVAHEVNNPIGFLNGSIGNAKEYIRDLIGHLEFYQKHYPEPAAPIQENAEAIDLEFLVTDLPKLLDAMTEASKRIKSISNSLRTFSRADTDHKVTANLHQGIDSTLMILKYRLKANENRPAIEIYREYSKIAPIECFPGQLNQVFMNILANAIDMFDEMAQTRTFAELQADPQEITIRTEAIPVAGGYGKQVYIRIRDNGKGMSAEIQEKIFDHLFTTKGVGKGTGLGLAIARQIVTEKHGGKIEVNSVLGKGTEFIISIPIAA